MGEHLAVNVDKLEKLGVLGAAKPAQGTEVVFRPAELGGPSSSSSAEEKEKEKVTVEVEDVNEEAPLIGIAECRICQEEDSVKNLETPCGCSGSLKYAHRKCVQHWCNEKGDITCEICHQPYHPGYTAPPRPEPTETVIDIGGGWQLAGAPINLHDPRLLAIAEAERQFLEAEYDDYNATNAGGAAFCRSAALILMALLLMRHALSMNDDDGEEDASTIVSLFLLRAIGFLLPCYIMVWAISVLQRRRQRQEAAALAATQFAFVVQSRQSRGLHFAIPSAAPTHVPAPPPVPAPAPAPSSAPPAPLASPQQEHV